MKRFFVFLLVFVALGSAAMAQDEGMTACFDAKQPIILPLDNYTQAVFGLKATSEQLEKTAAFAALYPLKYTFTSEAVTGQEYPYKCSIVFLHAEGIPYLHKTLLSFGVTKFHYDGKTYDINEMITVMR